MLRMLMLLRLAMTVLSMNDGGGSGGSEGGSNDGTEGGEAGTGDGDGGDGGEPSPLEQQALDAIEALKATGAEIPDALNAAVAEFRKARQDAGKYRGERNTERDKREQLEGQLAAISKALGVDDDDDELDPEALQQQMAKSTEDAVRARVELAAFRAASKLSADPDALLDSRTFLESIRDLDPDADNFSADLESAVKTAVESNPRLKVAPGGRRGPQQGPQGDPGRRAGSLEEAVNNRLTQPA